MTSPVPWITSQSFSGSVVVVVEEVVVVDEAGALVKGVVAALTTRASVVDGVPASGLASPQMVKAAAPAKIPPMMLEIMRIVRDTKGEG